MEERNEQQRLTLDQPVTYEVSVPGHLDESWTEWDGRMIARVEGESSDRPITVLTGTLDQAALHGLLRQLYGLGLPLISVQYIEPGAGDVGLPE